jgi:beta-lactamase regulating signal transducer with metallopeptidase domain
MSANLLITLPVWTAAGWTMLHVIWVGAAIGVLAALVRGLLNRARSQTRYSVALAFLLALSISPVVIFVAIFKPDSGSRAALIRPPAHASARLVSLTNSERQRTDRQGIGAMGFDQHLAAPPRSRLESVVTHLPWIWLCGSLSTLVVLATGLIGVEQMRRSSRLIERGELPRRCRALADSLGIARRVSVGICDRLAMPVLIGIARPLILLPPAVLSGWSLEQLEMVLLHELAHVRRWDNLVNLIQRFVESVLFFHPVVWWLSGWVRLERELCCDCVVIERVGQPIAYAEMLVALAGPRHGKPGTVLAMADRQVLTRIRRLLNQEERSMRLTMPEGLGLLGAAVIGISLALGLPAAQLAPVSDSNDETQRAPGAPVDNVKDIPVMEARTTSARANPDDTKATTLRSKRVEPRNPRAITLFPRDERQLQIVQLPTTHEGVVTYKCRGGIKIVCKSQKVGTIEMEADEAVIKRVQPQNYDERAAATKGVDWLDEADLPMEVLLKGDVILCQDVDKTARKRDQMTVRAPQLDYDFVTGRVVAPPLETLAVVAPPETPIADAVSSKTRPRTTAQPGGKRSTSLFPRNAQRLQIRQVSGAMPGVFTYVCQGGIRIVSKSRGFGSFSMEADEAVIVRYLHNRKGETVAGPSGETWVEEDELPMEVHMKGDVIFRQDQGKLAGKGVEQTVRASQLDYDFVTKRLVATDAEIVALSASGLPTSTLSASRIELSLVRKPDGSLAPVEHRDIRAGHQSSTEDSVIETVTPSDLKPSEP